MAYNKSYMAKRDSGDTAALARQTANLVNGMIEKNKLAIMKSLPKGFNFDRMCRTLINAISTTPQLAQCTPASLFLSSVRAFSLGLEPNGALAEAYLVPYWNSKKACNEAQFMPSYRGLQNLARRSGEIVELFSKTVKENDIFEVEEGTERKIVHKPNYTQDRGKLLCVYAVFKTKDGNVDFEVMSIAEIDEIRARSKASTSGPWVTDYEEMAKKTVMRRLLKRAPMSIEMSQAVSFDNNAATGDFSTSANIIDLGDFDISDAETPAEIQGKVNADRTAELREQIKAKIAPVSSVNDYSDYTQLIGQALKDTGAPIEIPDVVSYMAANNMTVGVDTDFRAIVNEAAGKLC